MKKNLLKAFSLIEISISLIIIGILMTGILKGREIYDEMAVTSAQSLTNSSPVAVIDGLELWLETTRKLSFKRTDSYDGTPIGVWYDLNPQAPKNQSRDATQTNTTLMPIYTRKAFKSLPALKFSSGNTMYIDGLFMVGSYYTIFIVEKRTAAGDMYYFRGGNWGTVSGSIHIGYRYGTSITVDHYATGLDFGVPVFSYPIPRLVTFILDEEGKKIWVNGGGAPDASNTRSDKLLYNGNFRVGDSYNGYIAEIIIYDRALKDSERQAIESYLGQKYSIKIK